jgi:hypothetical protein
MLHIHHLLLEHDKQDRQGKAAFNERSPTRPSNKRQWQRAQEDPQTKIEQGIRQSTGRQTTT